MIMPSAKIMMIFASGFPGRAIETGATGLSCMPEEEGANDRAVVAAGDHR